jgi:hypothetical protein
MPLIVLNGLLDAYVRHKQSRMAPSLVSVSGLLQIWFQKNEDKEPFCSQVAVCALSSAPTFGLRVRFHPEQLAEFVTAEADFLAGSLIST